MSDYISYTIKPNPNLQEKHKELTNKLSGLMKNLYLETKNENIENISLEIKIINKQIKLLEKAINDEEIYLLRLRNNLIRA